MSMITPSAFRHPKSQTLINSLLLRRLSTKPTPQSLSSPPPQQQQQQQQRDYSIITQAVELLQAPQHEWNTTQLNHLLFSDSYSSSPGLLPRITRRLPSSSHALKFLQYLQNISPSPDTQSLSCTFQAVLELASREPDSPANLSQLFNTSKEWNLPLTIKAAALLLGSFGRSGIVEEALALFNELNSCSKNTHVRNVLIGLLLRSDRIGDALKMVDEMFQQDAQSDYCPDDVTIDIVLSSLQKRKPLGRIVSEEEIVNLVLRFGQHGVFPKPVVMTQLITRLCRNRKTNKAWDLFHELMKMGAVMGSSSCNALLTGLGRVGDFKRMNILTKRMAEIHIQPNVITFGILINHLCKLRKVDGALEVFQKMIGGVEEIGGVSVKPDVVIYNTLIDGLCKVGRQEEGMGLVEQMKSQKGCAPNTVTYNCLIDGFCKAGEIERGKELFNEMTKEGISPNVITINTLIDGMCRLGRTSSAVEFFGEMQRKGLKGNAVTYTALINAFCLVNNIDKAMELFNQMVEGECSPDAIVYYALISGLSQAGRMDDASYILSKLKEDGFYPDTVCYNVLIGGFCRKNKLDRAYMMVKEMEETGVKPDTVTYNTLISCLTKSGDLKLAHRLLRKMIKEGLVPTIVTYGAVIHAYCLHRNVDEALKVFEDMAVTTKVLPNTVIYNILIDSLCKNNKVRYALSLIDDMKSKGVSPNATTYNAIFKGLREENWLKKALELMDRMIHQGCNPDYITMEILTEWLSAVGETEKLKNFVKGHEVSAPAA